MKTPSPYFSSSPIHPHFSTNSLLPKTTNNTPIKKSSLKKSRLLKKDRCNFLANQITASPTNHIPSFFSSFQHQLPIQVRPWSLYATLKFQYLYAIYFLIYFISIFFKLGQRFWNLEIGAIQINNDFIQANQKEDGDEWMEKALDYDMEDGSMPSPIPASPHPSHGSFFNFVFLYFFYVSIFLFLSQ